MRKCRDGPDGQVLGLVSRDSGTSPLSGCGLPAGTSTTDVPACSASTARGLGGWQGPLGLGITLHASTVSGPLVSVSAQAPLPPVTSVSPALPFTKYVLPGHRKLVLAKELVCPSAFRAQGPPSHAQVCLLSEDMPREPAAIPTQGPGFQALSSHRTRWVTAITQAMSSAALGALWKPGRWPSPC